MSSGITKTRIHVANRTTKTCHDTTAATNVKPLTWEVVTNTFPINVIKENDDKSLQSALDSMSTQLESARAEIKAGRMELLTSSQALNTARHNVTLLNDSLEERDLELRQARTEKEDQRIRHESIVEDLQGEIQRLKEVEKDFSEQLRRERAHADTDSASDDDAQRIVPQQMSLAGGFLTPGPSGSAGSCTTYRSRIIKLEEDIKRANEEKNRLVPTLQAVYSIIKAAIDLPRFSSVISTISTVPTLIQSVLSMEDVKPDVAMLDVAIKRERDEDGGGSAVDGAESGAGTKKRAKLCEVVEIDSD